MLRACRSRPCAGHRTVNQHREPYADRAALARQSADLLGVTRVATKTGWRPAVRVSRYGGKRDRRPRPHDHRSAGRSGFEGAESVANPSIISGVGWLSRHSDRQQARSRQPRTLLCNPASRQLAPSMCSRAPDPLHAGHCILGRPRAPKAGTVLRAVPWSQSRKPDRYAAGRPRRPEAGSAEPLSPPSGPEESRVSPVPTRAGRGIDVRLNPWGASLCLRTSRQFPGCRTPPLPACRTPPAVTRVELD